MPWCILILAASLEVAWILSVKLSEAFSRFGPSMVAASAFVASIELLWWSLRVLPLRIAYNVWMAIGAFGALLACTVMFGQLEAQFRSLTASLILAGLALTRSSWQE